MKNKPIPSSMLFQLFLVLTLLSGCSMPIGRAAPLEPAQSALAMAVTETPTAEPRHYQPPADATATPTPFQPLPPTPVIFPTYTPTLTPTPLPTSTPEPVNPSDGNRAGNLGSVQPDNQVNILLLGSDKRKWGTSFRTDTIILATLNMDLGTINLTSFPRDLYVTIPNYGTNRINTAWGYGGFKSLADTFQENFGVRPDHYVLINFSAFKRFIDSLGGLEVNVANKMSDYRAGRLVTIGKGRQYMDADLVLWYVRSRKTSNDFYRNRRQQEVLRAVFEKMLTINGLSKIPEFYDLYKDTVTTDLDWDFIASWLPLATKINSAEALQSYYVGPEAAYDWITYEGAMVLIPRPAEVRKTLRKALNLP